MTDKGPKFDLEMVNILNGLNRNLHDYKINRHTLAVHESAHAIASIAFGCGFDRAFIDPAHGCGSVWIKAVNCQSREMKMADLTFEETIGYMIIKYAGMAAEGKLMGTGIPDPRMMFGHGGADDFKHAAYGIEACHAHHGVRSDPTMLAIAVMTITWDWVNEPDIWERITRFAGTLCDNVGIVLDQSYPAAQGVPKVAGVAAERIKQLAQIKDVHLQRAAQEKKHGFGIDIIIH